MATIGGAIQKAAKQHFTSLDFYRSPEPEGAKLPYVTFEDPTAQTPALRGSGKVLARERRVQFDLWQTPEDADLDLPEQLADFLDGLAVSVAGRTIHRVRVVGFQRMPEEVSVHHLYDVLVHAGSS